MEIILFAGTALQCYTCDTLTNRGCETASNAQSMDCVDYFIYIGVGLVLDPSAMACQKLQVQGETSILVIVMRCIVK